MINFTPLNGAEQQRNRDYWYKADPRLIALYNRGISYAVILADLRAQFGRDLTPGQLSGHIFMLQRNGILARREDARRPDGHARKARRSINEEHLDKVKTLSRAQVEKPAGSLADMPWSLDEIQLLTQLYGEGLSLAQIGQRMGRTKESVNGKLHRIGVPARPSPIKEARTAPILRSNPARPSLPNLAASVLVDADAAPPGAPALDRAGCCWPTWKRKDTAYWEAISAGRYMQCDAPRRLGKRYCDEHMRLSGRPGNASGTVSMAFAPR